jgi:hypothetical protein
MSEHILVFASPILYRGYRRFLVVHLTAEQLADEERWHELSREAVGTHTDYGEPGELRPREGWARF